MFMSANVHRLYMCDYLSPYHLIGQITSYRFITFNRSITLCDPLVNNSIDQINPYWSNPY